MTIGLEQEREVIERAVRVARDTRLFEAEPGIRHRTGSVFLKLFDGQSAVLIADGNTFRAAGRDVQASLERAGVAHQEPLVFGPHVHADIDCVEELERFLRPLPSIPIAVGSGTLNDLTKLAAHRLNRAYMVVGTAASMDGYAAFGASILKDGSKETMECPGPRAVLADLEVIGRAPAELNSSGYADLLAKIPAGADWMLADAAGVQPIVKPVWDTVQTFLRSWVRAPAAIPAGEPGPLAHLLNGLVMSGLAMQEMLTSRPASGETLRKQLTRLRDSWGELSSRLKAQLVLFEEAREMLANAGCPCAAGQIGISRVRLRVAYEQCCYLRRRFTVLDVAHRTGLLHSALDNLFGPQGVWSQAEEASE